MAANSVSISLRRASLLICSVRSGACRSSSLKSSMPMLRKGSLFRVEHADFVPVPRLELDLPEGLGDAVLRDPLKLFGLADLPRIIGIVHLQTPSTA